MGKLSKNKRESHHSKRPHKSKKKRKDGKKLKKLFKLLREMSSSSSESESDYSSTSESTSESDVEVEHHSPERPPEVSDNLNDLLGLNPDIENATGPPLNEQLWARWSSYIAKGIDKDTIKDLHQKFLIPSNAGELHAPQVNPEVLVLLSNEQKATDAFLSKLQTHLGKGLTGIGQFLGLTIDLPDRSEETKQLADVAKLIAAGFNNLTTHRRFLVSSRLSPSAKKVALDCPADTLLFGNTFQEKCRAAKEVEKTSKEIKVPERNPTSTSLNFKRPTFKTRKKDVQATSKPHWKKGSSTSDRDRQHRRRFQKS